MAIDSLWMALITRGVVGGRDYYCTPNRGGAERGEKGYVSLMLTRPNRLPWVWDHGIHPAASPFYY